MSNAAKKRGQELVPCKPFIKWVGGKSQLVDELLKYIPADINRYFEPFIGGGALLFNLQPRDAVISDINPELINLYTVVRDNVEGLIVDLENHIYEEDYFYKVRNVDRTVEYKGWSAVQKASRFIFLNKTCFNGLYRVNASGFFNVPFGRYTNPRILDEQNLRACSAVLQNITIELKSFEEIEEKMQEGDFVYFDPPYVPLSVSSSFTSYSKDGFNLDMQRSLYELCCRLNKRKIKFLLSNSSAPFILDLYKEFNVRLVAATRSINSKADKRGAVDEVIVSNF